MEDKELIGYLKDAIDGLKYINRDLASKIGKHEDEIKQMMWEYDKELGEKDEKIEEEKKKVVKLKENIKGVTNKSKKQSERIIELEKYICELGETCENQKKVIDKLQVERVESLNEKQVNNEYQEDVMREQLGSLGMENERLKKLIQEQQEYIKQLEAENIKLDKKATELEEFFNELGKEESKETEIDEELAINLLKRLAGDC